MAGGLSRGNGFNLTMLRPQTSALLLLSLTSLPACEEKKYGTGGGGLATKYSGAPQAAAKTKAKAPPTSSPQEKAKKPSTPSKDAAEKKELSAPPAAYAALTKRWKLGELADLGPAGPVTAGAAGAYFITRRDQLLLAPQTKTGFQPVSAPPEAFAKYGRGPSLSQTHAYWISESGHLLRASLASGKSETLFKRARPGTRTSVQSIAGRDVVAFIAQIEDEPLAFAWASPGSGKSETVQLSPDGSSASSVSLVPAPPHARAVILEGRTSMSPVHARTIRVTPRRVSLAPDEVVWVGPPSHVLTEIHALSRADGDCAAFLPTAKDFNDFGMAQLSISDEGGECPTPDWQLYPNGLDPAPVATGHICGGSYVLFAKPSEAHPRSPQELHLAQLQQTSPQEGEVIARSRAFNEISLAPTQEGALIVWTADKRTWAMNIGCPDGT